MVKRSRHSIESLNRIDKTLKLSGEPLRDPFKALGDPTRRRIVEALALGERPVETIVAELDTSYAVISQHLQVMLAAGLVERRADGRKRIYRLRGDALGELSHWLDGQRERWAKAIGELNSFLDRRS